MMRDLRYAARLLIKSPGFTIVAVLVLALGIGANTAVFSLVNAMLLQPLPTDAPRIVGVYSRDPTRLEGYRAFSYESYQQIRADRSLFEDATALTMMMVGETQADSTRRVFASVVSSSYFSTLGVALAAGREFSADEDRPGSQATAVIVSYGYARRKGLAPAEMLGKPVTINARELTVVGVTPEGFSGTLAIFGPEFWLPLGAYEGVADDVFNERRAKLSDPTHRPLMIVARLRPGLDLASAAGGLAALSERMEQADPAGNRNHVLEVQKLSRTALSTSPARDRGIGTFSALLMGMSGLVLLVACLNLANMLLARGNARRKEIAVRLALGGSRWRVIRQLLAESSIVAIVGAAAGLLLAVWATGIAAASMRAILPMPLTFDGRPDVRILAATILFAALSTLAAGLAPAWKVTRPDVLPDLKEQPQDLGGGRRFGMRNLLVVGQVAVSLALLTAAGLFMRGAVNAGVADPGFPLSGGALANISPALAGYDETRGRAAILRILERVRTVPGVASASLASLVPFGDIREGRRVQKAGTPQAAPGEREPGIDASYTVVGADYFETLRIPVLRGRGFTLAEEESAARNVAVIDEPLARQLFAGDDAIGRQLQIASGEGASREPLEIVGVVGGIRDNLFDKGPNPHLYIPFGSMYRRDVYVHIRIDSPGTEAGVLGMVRREIRSADAGIPIISLRTLEQHRDASLVLWVVNTGAAMFALFGAIALLLAAVGVYGVRSYVVSRRTREIGIRMALGATAGDVIRLVLRESLILTATGVSIGLLMSWGVAKALAKLLYEVSSLDPMVFAVAPAVLVAAAILAAYVPARRATRIQPLAALRTD